MCLLLIKISIQIHVAYTFCAIDGEYKPKFAT